MKTARAWIARAAVVLALAGLLAWAFHNAPLGEIWAALLLLRPWQIVSLLLINILIYLSISLRWWIIVRASNPQVPFWPILAVRLASFGISYFTLGPQVGGEPIQVLALRNDFGLTYLRATASVVMDKLLEFLINFLLLALGLQAILYGGLATGKHPWLMLALVPLIMLMAWPILHILLMYNRILPVTYLIRALSFLPQRSGLLRFISASEWLAREFCRRHPGALLASIGVSLLAGAGMLLEYALMLRFLGFGLPGWQALAGWTAGWLSFLVPLPGGLGALEASQVFALGFFNISPSQAISLTLLMRARDLIIGSLGLFLAGRGIIRVK